MEQRDADYEQHMHGEMDGIASVTCDAISLRSMGDANRFTQTCTMHAIHAVNEAAPPNFIPADYATTYNNNVDELTLEEKLQRSKSTLGDMILCPHK
jgi:hypothetical protein